MTTENLIARPPVKASAVVAEALSWCGTPYAHMGRVKGAGCDCATFLAEVGERSGATPHIVIPYYPMDWHMHRNAEQYMLKVLEYCDEVGEPPLPADIVLWHYGRTFSHGALVIRWPAIVHAYIGQSVFQDDARSLEGRARRVFRLKGVEQ